NRLAGVDACFATIAKDWANPKNAVSALLFVRTHGYFRGACEHAMAGQLPETFALTRAVLETAAYGLHIALHPELAEVWMRRHDDIVHERAAKAEFLVG